MPNTPSEALASISGSILKDTVKKITAALPIIYDKAKIDFSAGFDVYIEKAYANYNNVRTLLHRTEGKPLYDIYVPCNLRYKTGFIIKEPCIDNIFLEDNNCVLITGAGGAGKSMVMRHLYLNAINEFNEGSAKIPVIVNLRDLEQDNTNILDCIYFELNKFGNNMIRSNLEHALEIGIFLLLLDGIDELSTEKLESFYKELDVLKSKYDKNLYVMTSRPIGDFYEVNNFIDLKMRGLTKEQASTLITKLDYDEKVMLASHPLVVQKRKGTQAKLDRRKITQSAVNPNTIKPVDIISKFNLQLFRGLKYAPVNKFRFNHFES